MVAALAGAAAFGGAMEGATRHTTLRPPSRAAAGRPRRVDALMGWFAAGLAIASALAVGVGTLWVRSAPQVLADVTIRVADADVAVPSSWLRSAGVAGPVERLDLIIPLPALVEGSAQDDGPVFVTLSRPNGSMDPADQTALLYARYLSADGDPGVADGLIRREFRAGTPYSGEDLLLSVPDGRAFAARCFKAAIAARMKAACLAAFRANGLDVQIRFAPGVLPHWRALMERTRRLVGP